MTDDHDEFDDFDDTASVMPSAMELRRLSPLDWARFGARSMAYTRPVLVNGQAAIAIHAADGTPIGAAPTLALATAAILQHGMGAALVH